MINTLQNESDRNCLDALLDRANTILHRANTCNKGQYSHGINSGIMKVEYRLKALEEKCPRTWGQARPEVDRLGEGVNELAGWLYRLKEGL